jgi:opacity protein-like surface antigen
MRTPALLAALVVVSVSSAAHAADGIYVGVGAAVKADSSNPYAGSSPLLHVPLELELGLPLSPALELHVGGAYGKTASTAGGDGSFGEATAGVRWRFFQRGRLGVAADLTLGWSRAELENKGVVAETNGLVAEPELELEVRLSRSLSLVVGVLARGELLVGDMVVDGEASAPLDRHQAQLGYGSRAMLRLDF